MSKKVISVPNAPELPFSPGIKAGDYIFVSGQVGFEDPQTGEEVKGIESQTRQCILNIEKVLKSGGSNLNDVVKTTVFLRNADDFHRMNEVYQGFFQRNQPARSTVVTGMVMPRMLVEIECIAYHP
jgi:2-iminobutanoate/2-iminopropanoate deaminase